MIHMDKLPVSYDGTCYGWTRVSYEDAKQILAYYKTEAKKQGKTKDGKIRKTPELYSYRKWKKRLKWIKEKGIQTYNIPPKIYPIKTLCHFHKPDFQHPPYFIDPIFWVNKGGSGIDSKIRNKELRKVVNTCMFCMHQYLIYILEHKEYKEKF